MNQSLADRLPHSPPAILLQEILRNDELSITASVTLSEIQSPWIESGGMPIAFGLEMIAQASALLISRSPTPDPDAGQLVGGRLASCNRFQTDTRFLPLHKPLQVTAKLHGSSSMGYFQIHGTIESDRLKLLSVECTVLALRAP